MPRDHLDQEIEITSIGSILFDGYICQSQSSIYNGNL